MSYIYLKRKTIEERPVTATILNNAQLPNHKNIATQEKRALHDLKTDSSKAIIIKAEKGNCFVVINRYKIGTTSGISPCGSK